MNVYYIDKKYFGMVAGIKFDLNKSLFTKDPQETELGKKILEYSVILIDQLGFEKFTFKKLAKEIGSAEKSIYRYFDNKHLLLLFLTSWYWDWVHYLIQTNLINIVDPKIKLDVAIECIVQASSENVHTAYINERVLHQVIIKEGSKSYHTLEVDDENSAGLFFSYKSLTQTVTNVIKEVNGDFPYSKSLSSSLFEMSNNQIYFADHLPGLTSLKSTPSCQDELIKMLKFFAYKLLS
jgi:hypothetical protein